MSTETEGSTAEKPLLTLGVVADTHIPDRANRLNPYLAAELRAAGVERILHAGDICAPRVLEELGEVAPVTAVRGNRDWLFSGKLAWVERLELAGVKIALLHGHGDWRQYFYDKWKYLVRGYDLKRMKGLLLGIWPGADVVVFGHTHHVEITRVGKTLLFNPGSATTGYLDEAPPSFGVLEIYAGQQVHGRIIALKGGKPLRREWKFDEF